MNIKIIINIGENLENSKEVVDRLVEENMTKKLDGYLKKYDKKEDAEGTINLKVDRNSRDLFNGTLQITLDRDNFRYSREDFKKLDDLINHLFDHFKEELSSK